MGLFRKESKKGKNKEYKVKLTHDDEMKYKMRSENVADPILEAVNEAQPFEDAAYDHKRNSSSLNGEGDMNDVFGNPISNPDVSNPARSRDERPLDTIRAFEYSITGDPSYRQQLETPQLGWRVREDFPFYTNNPYGQSSEGEAQKLDEYGHPVSANTAGMSTQQGVYKRQPKKEEKKKKKGFLGFGRKH